MSRDDTLKDRCRKFLEHSVGDPVQELYEFVIAEQGRKLAPELDDSVPLCLYFETDAEREDFVAMVQQINPNMRARKVLQ